MVGLHSVYTTETVKILVTEEMVGHRLGEFSQTRKFHRHGGKMQKELEQKAKESEIAAAQAAQKRQQPIQKSAPAKKYEFAHRFSAERS